MSPVIQAAITCLSSTEAGAVHRLQQRCLLPFRAAVVTDIVERTHVAQDQKQCLLAAELVIKAQRDAKHVVFQPVISSSE